MDTNFRERLQQHILCHALLYLLLGYVLLAQCVPAVGEHYARHLYPLISYLLSLFSKWIPFALGDLFVLVCIGAALLCLFRLLFCGNRWARLRRGMTHAVRLYVWFYLAWGLNYSQPPFYGRTGTAPVEFDEAGFLRFAQQYINRLNEAYLPVPEELASDEQAVIGREIEQLYRSCPEYMGIHRPQHDGLQAKTMLYTPLASMVGVTGSMAPFFCEFTLNGDLLPLQYPSTYAHEFSHYLGIAREAEANFYAYQVCTRSTLPLVRYSGYFALLPHLLSNARRLLDEEEYAALLQRIRPEVKLHYEQQRHYWTALYNPTIGRLQDRLYDLYLKGNKISTGRKNYSEVIGLLLSWEQADASSSLSWH